MAKGILKQANHGKPERVRDEHVVYEGIQFDDFNWTPEERQLEITRQTIWEKLRGRLDTRTV